MMIRTVALCYFLIRQWPFTMSSLIKLCWFRATIYCFLHEYYVSFRVSTGKRVKIYDDNNGLLFQFLTYSRVSLIPYYLCSTILELIGLTKKEYNIINSDIFWVVSNGTFGMIEKKSCKWGLRYQLYLKMVRFTK